MKKKSLIITNPVLLKIRDFMGNEAKKRDGTIFGGDEEAKIEIELENGLIADFGFGNRTWVGSKPHCGPWVCGFEIRGEALWEYAEKEWGDDREDYDDLPGYIPYADFEEDGTIEEIMVSINTWVCQGKNLKLIDYLKLKA